jgi:hypothetical protein
VSPSQFPSFIILVYQFQESFTCVGFDEPLPDRLSSSDMSELVKAELGPSFLRVRFQRLDFLEAEC